MRSIQSKILNFLSLILIVSLASVDLFASDILQKIDAKKLLSPSKDENKTIAPNQEIIFIDFWASWCSSCKSNLEKIAKFPEIKSKNKDRLSKLFLVSLDENPEDAKQFFELNEISIELKNLKQRAYISSKSEEELATHFPKLDAIPFFVVYDTKKSKILWSHSGSFSKADLEKIKSYLKRKTT